MSNYMSRAEIEEISEGLITVYAQKHNNKVVQSIDIEHFITEFLSLQIECAAFAEDDGGKMGFLADGRTPLLIHQNGKIVAVKAAEVAQRARAFMPMSQTARCLRLML